MKNHSDSSSQYHPLSTFLFKLFHIFWLPVFTVLFSISVFQYYTYNHKLFVLTLAIEIWLIALFAIVKGRNFINSLSNRTVYTLLSVVSVLMFILLFVTGRSMWITPISDTGTVYYSVAEILRDGSISREINEYTISYWYTNTSNHDYFLVCPNNAFLVFYQLCYYRFLRLFVPIDLYDTSGCNAAVLLNSVSILLAVIFGFLTAKKAKDNCTAFLFLIISFLFVPYYLNAYKVYSDTLSLPYVTATLYFYVKGDQTDNGKKAVVYHILTGLALSLGILIKGSVAILLVALVIYTFLRTATLRKNLSTLFCLILTCAAILIIWPLYKNNCSWLDTSEADKYQLPAMHYLMMAAEGDGDFKLEDAQYTMSFPTYAERKQANTEEFIRRVKSYDSAYAYINFLFNKVARVMADGYYAQKNHLNGTFKVVPQLMDWMLGKYRNVFYRYRTTYVSFFYLSMLIAAVLGIIRKNHPISTLFNICIFGTFLFFAFWEIKSRYLLNFVPIFMLCSVFTISDCAEIYRNRQGRHMNKPTK